MLGDGGVSGCAGGGGRMTPLLRRAQAAKRIILSNLSTHKSATEIRCCVNLYVPRAKIIPLSSFNACVCVCVCVCACSIYRLIHQSSPSLIFSLNSEFIDILAFGFFLSASRYLHENDICKSLDILCIPATYLT